MPVTIPKTVMARVILINPPSHTRTGAPLLSQMYLASSLLKTGHHIKIVDLAARFLTVSIDKLLKELSSYQPDVIGLGLYTTTAKFGYELSVKIRSQLSKSVLLVAGGPHATAMPEEPLNHGFDVSVRGEGEVTLKELLGLYDNKGQWSNIKGISFKTSSGIIQHCKPQPLMKDLDNLPFAVNSLHLFDPDWYFRNGNMRGNPTSIITSRGCPGRCTFCANIVTGKRFRYRSPEFILKEMKFYHDKYGTTFFSVLDDSFTYDQDRVNELCDRFIQVQKIEGFDFKWSCITRSDRLSRRILKKLKEAGCLSINFGVESGSPETLRRIRKGIDLTQVRKTLRWCNDVGIRTQVNFMLGFPWETVKHLKETLDFMTKISSMVDAFSTGGVVIPFPGTELYRRYKSQYGFDHWWLDRTIDKGYEIAESGNDLTWSDEMVRKVYFEDPVLGLDFFKYSANVKNMIQTCLEYKGSQTIEKLNINDRLLKRD